jgi:pyrimidine-nucleoside phosphorylase
MSALLMAILLNDMTNNEIFSLTKYMADSGNKLDLSPLGENVVDKHSTGGVGDKTTLIITPIVAACGVKVAKMSGKGLGHTGGTIDKLESVEGFSTSLSPQEFFEVVKNTGLAVVGQTGNLTPADKKLYALRDVTATVDSLPLIASSIMSKKLAAGAKNIVLDVKYGSGAFMKTPDSATELAQAMVKIGNNCGRNTSAVITNMDIPLGFNIGNALEVKEAIAVLTGNGPEDLKEVCLTLATQIVHITKKCSKQEARLLTEDALASGKAFAKFKEWIAAQGGNTDWIENTERFPQASVTYEIKADSNGFVAAMDTEKIGICAVILGAGRETKESTIDMSAGIILKKKTGDKICKGDVLAVLHTNNNAAVIPAKECFSNAITVTDKAPSLSPLIYNII